MSRPTSTSWPPAHSTPRPSTRGSLAWSTLEELVTEAAARAMIAYTIDTGDPEKEADHLRFSTEVLPRMEERSVELARRLVESGYSTPSLETTLARFRTQIEIFRDENVPIFAELEEHSARYQRITGSITVEWDGVERPPPSAPAVPQELGPGSPGAGVPRVDPALSWIAGTS